MLIKLLFAVLLTLLEFGAVFSTERKDVPSACLFWCSLVVGVILWILYNDGEGW